MAVNSQLSDCHSCNTRPGNFFNKFSQKNLELSNQLGGLRKEKIELSIRLSEYTLENQTLKGDISALKKQINQRSRDFITIKKTMQAMKALLRNIPEAWLEDEVTKVFLPQQIEDPRSEELEKGMKDPLEIMNHELEHNSHEFIKKTGEARNQVLVVQNMPELRDNTGEQARNQNLAQGSPEIKKVAEGLMKQELVHNSQAELKEEIVIVKEEQLDRPMHQELEDNGGQFRTAAKDGVVEIILGGDQFKTTRNTRGHLTVSAVEEETCDDVIMADEFVILGAQDYSFPLSDPLDVNSLTTASQSNITAASQDNITAASQSNITVASQDNITAASQSNITAASQSNITVASQSNITAASQSNITAASQSNITAATQSNITAAAASQASTLKKPGEFICTKCQVFVTFKRREYLLEHNRNKHEKRKEYKCKSCNRIYSSVRSFNQHMRDIHPKGERKKYACDNCGLMLASMGGLTRHKKKMYNCLPQPIEDQS